MTKVVIEFTINNSYYRDDDDAVDFEAVKDTLWNVLQEVNYHPIRIVDGNGNSVGRYRLVEDE